MRAGRTVLLRRDGCAGMRCARQSNHCAVRGVQGPEQAGRQAAKAHAHQRVATLTISVGLPLNCARGVSVPSREALNSAMLFIIRLARIADSFATTREAIGRSSISRECVGKQISVEAPAGMCRRGPPQTQKVWGCAKLWRLCRD